jgi:hypothetical protein
MALPQLSTDDLDLTALPERLDDQTLERVQAIASAPLPPPRPCDETHLTKCLRVMLSVLPRKTSDELSGELFVAAYQRKLRDFSNDAISYMSDKALETCRWFPTIAECMELASEAPRTDEAVQRKIAAYQIASAEKALIDALDAAEPTAEAAIAAEDFAGAMAALASLRAPIDAFFEEVTVNDEDVIKRSHRLSLLARFRAAVHNVADFSRIEG